MLRLRCKARSGSHALPGLSPHSRLRDMQAALAALTGVPAPAQRLLHGFPPRSLDLSDGERRLGELGIHSGEEGGGRRLAGSAAPRAAIRLIKEAVAHTPLINRRSSRFLLPGEVTAPGSAALPARWKCRWCFGCVPGVRRGWRGQGPGHAR